MLDLMEDSASAWTREGLSSRGFSSSCRIESDRIVNSCCHFVTSYFTAFSTQNAAHQYAFLSLSAPGNRICQSSRSADVPDSNKAHRARAKPGVKLAAQKAVGHLMPTMLTQEILSRRLIIRYIFGEYKNVTR
jgi:hypothetical protein